MQQASPFTASQVLSLGVESSRLRQSCELFEEIDAHGMHLVPDRCPLKRDPTGLSLVLAAGAACARQCCRHRVRGRIAAQAAFSWRFYPLEIDPVDLCHRPCGDQIQHPHFGTARRQARREATSDHSIARKIRNIGGRTHKKVDLASPTVRSTSAVSHQGLNIANSGTNGRATISFLRAGLHSRLPTLPQL